MRVVQIRLPMKVLDRIDEQVSKGFYSSRSDFIRSVIRDTLKD